MQLWINILKDIQKNEKDVKTDKISAKDLYAGFGIWQLSYCSNDEIKR